MIKKAIVALFTASVTTAFSSSQLFDLEALNQNEAASPEPGSMQVFANVKSINQLFKTVAMILPYSVLTGKSYDVDFEKEIGGIDFKLNQVNITSALVGSSSIEFVGDTDTLRTTLSNVNMNFTVDAEAKSLIPVPLDITSVTLKNFTLMLDLAVSSDDQVHWQMTEGTIMSIEDFDVICEQAIWQKLFDDLKPEAWKVLNQTTKLFESVIQGFVDALNEELANTGATTFDLTVFGMPLNMTMTQAPEFSNEKDEIMVHIDGEFVSNDMSKFVHADPTWANYTSIKQKEQLWIHQSTINSMLYDLNKTLPGGKHSSFQNQTEVLLKELTAKYGADMDCSGMVAFPKVSNSEPVTISKESGVSIGDASQGGLKMKIDFMCAANNATEKELAVTIETGMHLNLQFAWDDFTFYAKFAEPQLMQSVVTPVTIELDEGHEWDTEMTQVLKDVTDGLNAKYGEVFDLRKINPLISYAAMNLKHSILTPFVEDEFVLAGFSAIIDN